MKRFVVSQEEVGQRLDQFVAARLDNLSRSSIQKLTEKGEILVNEKTPKVSYKLKLGDKIELKLDLQPSIADINLPVIYEDDDCLVINKPAGVLAHSKGDFNPEATVATFLSSKVKGMDGNRAGIVHRLDRATSGVMICAKTPEALSWLQKQFSSRKVKKHYIAIVKGMPEPPEAIIDMPIERNPKQPQTFRTGSNGKPAQTQ